MISKSKVSRIALYIIESRSYYSLAVPEIVDPLFSYPMVQHNNDQQQEQEPKGNEMWYCTVAYLRLIRTVTAAMAGGKTRELEAAHE